MTDFEKATIERLDLILKEMQNIRALQAEIKENKFDNSFNGFRKGYLDGIARSEQNGEIPVISERNRIEYERQHIKGIQAAQKFITNFSAS